MTQPDTLLPYEKPLFRPAGDRGLLVELGPGIDPEVNNRVRTLARALEKNKPLGIREIIPTYRSVLINYDPLETSLENLQKTIETGQWDTGRQQVFSETIVKIPVCYDEDLGPDTDNVMASSGLSREAVIEIHTRTAYLIYMVGFTPGFPFLGGLDPRLATPRLKTPRMSVPKGSVGIANNQTGIYPITSPGGWQIIGQTPLNLFAPEKENPFRYRAGDKIQFFSISRPEFDRIQKEEGLS